MLAITPKTKRNALAAILAPMALAFAFISSVALQPHLSSLSIVNTAEAAVSDWHKGVSIFPTHPTDFESESFRQSLRDARDMGANEVALIIPIYQADYNSSDIYAGWDTPTDQSLISAIDYAHSLGMKVMLKPHLGPQNGGWRAYIDAHDRDAWYRNYGNYLNHIGDIGSQTGAEGMCIATELISMAAYTSNGDNTARWEKIISDLRQHFGGYITYSANWGGSYFTEEVAHIGFWPSLDFIGISAYYPLAEGQRDPSHDALVGSWSYWNDNKIRALHEQYGKDIVFTEIGYRSAYNSHNKPYDWPQGGYDASEQFDDYQALFSYWNDQPYMKGIYIWNWESNPNHGGEGNTDYTPQNKPAESLIASWFAGTGTDPDPDPDNQNPDPVPGDQSPTSVNGEWTVSGQASPITPGQYSDLKVNVGISDKADNVIVDVEVFDQDSQRIHQRYVENQYIDSTSPLMLDPSFTPPGSGPYTVSVGIFNSDWTQMFTWRHSIITLSSSSDGGSTPPDGGTSPDGNAGPTTLDVWWPTDGSVVSGVQPWKAILTNRTLSDYTMYWQVDGDVLNEMYDSDVDYPHKEAWVDLEPWTWKTDGRYNIKFIAKDHDGNMIAEKELLITVTH